MTPEEKQLVRQQMELPYQNPFLLRSFELNLEQCRERTMMMLKARTELETSADSNPIHELAVKALDIVGPRSIALAAGLTHVINLQQQKKKLHVRFGLSSDGMFVGKLPPRLRIWALFARNIGIKACKDIWASWGLALYGEHARGAPTPLEQWEAEPVQVYCNPKHIMLVEWFRQKEA